ncbi:4017_t:CDS:2 [Paraglomus brasilianum]|uniref:4017_t:CDS:1 n=1 Tax=Paraglomus brasilianum TaxID=144538 RepID=A0A9N9FPB9_9GLOM|nr:4017_t:CDS:2 [Paraglomus brasilianum]
MNSTYCTRFEDSSFTSTGTAGTIEAARASTPATPIYATKTSPHTPPITHSLLISEIDRLPLISQYRKHPRSDQFRRHHKTPPKMEFRMPQEQSELNKRLRGRQADAGRKNTNTGTYSERTRATGVLKLLNVDPDTHSMSDSFEDALYILRVYSLLLARVPPVSISTLSSPLSSAPVRPSAFLILPRVKFPNWTLDPPARVRRKVDSSSGKECVQMVTDSLTGTSNNPVSWTEPYTD